MSFVPADKNASARLSKLTGAAKPAFIVKKNFHNEYELEKILTSGGSFADVALYKFKQTDETRIVKKLRIDRKTEKNRKKMRREGMILNLLEHQNIVNYYGCYLLEGDPCLVLGYYQGITLYDYMSKLNKEKKPISDVSIALMMRQMLQALQYCHENGVVHRDVSYNNVMLMSHTPDEGVRLIDFGEAIELTPERPYLRAIRGTGSFIAPEVILKNYNEKCDVWSLGVVMYFCLYFFSPYTNQPGSGKLKRKIVEQKYTQAFIEETGFVKRFLVYDKDERLSAKELLEELAPKLAIADEAVGHFGTMRHAISTADNLKNFRTNRGKTLFKEIVRNFVISKLMTNFKRDKIAKTFEAFDIDGNGELSKSELKAALRHYVEEEGGDEFAWENEHFDEVFAELDEDGNGAITFNEFLVGAVNQQWLFSADKAEAAFALFDVNGDGEISVEELKAAVNDPLMSDEAVEQILSEIDKDNNQVISKEEFMKALTPDD